MLHMLRTELGDARFWKAIRHYVQKHAGGSVETRDLARAVDEATGWNPDRFFEQWVFKAGHPELKVEYFVGRRAQAGASWRSRRRRRSKATRRCSTSRCRCASSSTARRKT